MKFSPPAIDSKNPEAWVVFSGQTELWWLKWLRPGFRHCYVLLNDGQHWISVDPLLNHMEVTVHEVPLAFNLPLWLEDRGHAVIKAPVERNLQKSAPFMLFTCVEAAKRILGLHARFVVTPWQLYHHLKELKKHSHNKKEIPHGKFHIRPQPA